MSTILKRKLHEQVLLLSVKQCATEGFQILMNGTYQASET